MSNGQYLTLAHESSGEVRVKASKFIAHAFPIADEGIFKERLAAIAREHHTARHICYGWVLGTEGERYRAFDAGEPSGSAGKPILRQLQGAGLTQAAIVVVRYFGGTLLGKAGLAHAFADAAKAALVNNETVNRTVLAQLEVRCDYTAVEEVKRQVHAADGVLENGAYGELCTLRLAVPMGCVAHLLAQWARMGIEATVPTKPL